MVSAPAHVRERVPLEKIVAPALAGVMDLDAAQPIAIAELAIGHPHVVRVFARLNPHGPDDGVARYRPLEERVMNVSARQITTDAANGVVAHVDEMHIGHFVFVRQLDEHPIQMVGRIRQPYPRRAHLRVAAAGTESDQLLPVLERNSTVERTAWLRCHKVNDVSGARGLFDLR